MSEVDTLVDVPLFEESESGRLASFMGGKDLSSFGKLALIVQNPQCVGVQVERLSALFLVTNVILMSHASRRIIKNVTLDVEGKHKQEIYPILNALRYYVSGEFSQLDNYTNWCDVIRGSGDFDEELAVRLSRIIKFITSAELSAKDIGQKIAETMLAVSVDGETFGQGFAVSKDNPCAVKFEGGSDQTSVVLNQSLFRSGFSMSLSYQKETVVIHVDGAQIDDALSAWTSSLGVFFRNEMLTGDEFDG